jgi:hypothetical protein
VTTPQMRREIEGPKKLKRWKLPMKSVFWVAEIDLPYFASPTYSSFATS